MATIEYDVSEQTIRTTKITDPLVKGTIGEYDVAFTFDSAWDTFEEKWAVFDPDNGDPWKQPIDNGACEFPGEVMWANSVIIGVYGVKDGVEFPTIWANRLWFKDGANVPADVSDYPEPSPVLAKLVSTDPQTFTDEQKAQARENIDALGKIEGTEGDVVIIGSNHNVEDGGKALSDLETVENVAYQRAIYVGDITGLEIIPVPATDMTPQLIEHSGAISGTVGNAISIITSSSYSHYIIPCDTIKTFAIATRQSAAYPAYIIETDANNVVTKVHTASIVTSTKATLEGYTITAESTSKKLYVMTYTSGATSGWKCSIYSSYGILKNNINKIYGSIGNLDTIGLYSSDGVTYLSDYSNGGVKIDEYNYITISSTTSYAYCIIDCTNIKKFRIRTRRSNSSSYPAYVVEAIAAKAIKVHTGRASTSPDWNTYEFEASPLAERIYVMVYRGGGQSSVVATIEYVVEDVAKIFNAKSSEILALQNDVAFIEEKEALTYDSLETDLLNVGKNAVMGINRTAGTKLLNFAFITDTHINGYGATVTYAQPSIDLFVKLCNQKYVDFGAFGGDMFSDYNLSHDDGLEAMGRVLSSFGKINCPLLITKGNHECNGKYIPLWDASQTPEWGNYYYWAVSSDGRSYDAVTEETWDGETPLHYSTGNDSGYEQGSRYSRADTIQDWEHESLSALRVRKDVTDNSSDPYGDYYYMDFTEEKIRVVILNGFNSSTTSANGLEQQVIGTAQMTWIVNTALNMPDASWKILFITHLHPTENNGTDFYDAIETFLTNGGKVLGIIHGHQHGDTYYTKLSNRSWMINFIGVNKGYTTILSDLGKKASYSVSVFTIDTVNEKIYETKFGVGTSREFPFEPTDAIAVQWGQA